MWYYHLNREKLYLRSYRTHNLWLDLNQKKVRTPRVTPFHAGLFKRMAKSYSTTRVLYFVYGMTFLSVFKSALAFTKVPKEELQEKEVYARLNTIFQKNKYGFHTRIMSDFDLLLQAMMNEKFLDDSTLYYDDPITSKEIEDMELGLNGDFTETDIKHLNKDRDSGHHDGPTCMRHPARFANNYEKSDDLSIYKVMPRGQKPKY